MPQTETRLSAASLYVLASSLGIIAGVADVAADVQQFIHTGESTPSISELLPDPEHLQDMEPEHIERANSPEFMVMVRANLKLFEANARFSEQIAGLMCAETEADWHLGLMGLRESYVKMLAEAITW